MFGWSIIASACRSASKRAITCAGIHAGLDDLQRHAAPHRPLLLGQEHHAKAPFADLLQQLVRADDRAGALCDRPPGVIVKIIDVPAVQQTVLATVSRAIEVPHAASIQRRYGKLRPDIYPKRPAWSSTADRKMERAFLVSTLMVGPTY